MHLKLDELIRAIGSARNHLVDIERLSDQDLRDLQKEFERIGRKADEANACVAQLRQDVQEVAARYTDTGPASSGRASPLRMKIFPLGQSRSTSQ